jgi:hypothetical protein
MVRLLSFLVIAVPLAACTARGGGNRGGDDDDSASGDDDDSQGDDDTGDDDTGDDDDDDDDDDTSPGGSVTGDIGCTGEYDVYRFTVNGAGSGQVTADTVSAATAADLAAFVLDGSDLTTATNLGSGDDELTCTYPPPAYQCPQFVAEYPASGTYYVVIYAYADSCAGSSAGYVMTVEFNGTPVALASEAQDQPLPQ